MAAAGHADNYYSNNPYTIHLGTLPNYEKFVSIMHDAYESKIAAASRNVPGKDKNIILGFKKQDKKAQITSEQRFQDIRATYDQLETELKEIESNANDLIAKLQFQPNKVEQLKFMELNQSLHAKRSELRKLLDIMRMFDWYSTLK